MYKGQSITVIIPCLNEEQGVERVLREEVRGYGRAYKRGFAAATCDLIVTLDGDQSYPVDALSYLIEAFLHLNVDFLNASRFPVRDPRAMSFKNKFGNLVLSLAMSL